MPEQFLPEPPSVDFLSSVSRAQRSLYAFTLTLVRQAADAEDVLQETNVVLWQKAAEFDTTRLFMPWALRIAHLQAMTHYQPSQEATHYLDGFQRVLAVDYAGQPHYKPCWNNPEYRGYKPKPEEVHWALYHLADDPGERHDLKEKEPAVFSQLKASYDRWEGQLSEPLWSFGGSGQMERW